MIEKERKIEPTEFPKNSSKEKENFNQEAEFLSMVKCMKIGDSFPYVLSIQAIMELLPHRYPMLMVDKVKDVILGEQATGIKNVTNNENFFMGHFPNMPVMPGVLIIEALAQTAGTLVMKTLQLTSPVEKEISSKTHGVYFMSIVDARFRKPVYPGDTIHLKVQKQHNRSDVWKFSGKALVDGTVVAEAIYTAMIREL